MTAGMFLGGLGTNPKIPFFGSRPTYIMEYLSKLFLRRSTGEIL